MSEPRPTLTFVIPAYQAAPFLRRSLEQVWAWLQALGRTAELLVVDDGSTDATPHILAQFAGEVAADDTRSPAVTFRSLRNQRNRGKGFSLRRAFLHASGDLVVFTDADLTYPVENVGELLVALERGAQVAIGSRMHLDSRYVVAPTFFGKLFTRHFMGRAFNLLARMLVVPGVHDTQAGLKGFQRDAARELATRVQLDRFSFDVELLYVAQRLQLRIVECPVLFLYRKEPSTVRFIRDSWAMWRDMVRIRLRGRRGAYDREPDAALVQDLWHGGAAPAAEPSVVTAAKPRKGLGQAG
jgi:dolichyl-phosphate beta-glucosyltransferase